MSDATQPSVGVGSTSTAAIVSAVIRRLFLGGGDSGRHAPDLHELPGVRVAFVDDDDTALLDVRSDVLPYLVLPRVAMRESTGSVARVVIAAEGRDAGIARAVIALLDPEAVAIELVHVTWLPGIALSRIDDQGIDNPSNQDLLMFEGAREALLERAGELRASGFQVTSHLRMNRSPADAIIMYLRERPAQLLVLGLGRHGAGIGRDAMHSWPLPLLFVNARG